MLGDASAL